MAASLPSPSPAPLVVGIGGTPKPGSSTEQALTLALASAARDGAETLMFGGAYLASLPLYLTPDSEAAGGEMIDAVRRADGILLASPGYHGVMSGMVKNAIDYLEATSRDPRAYLDGLPVGLIVTAAGWQATGSTLAALRATVHALRGWPTPMGAAINTGDGVLSGGVCRDAGVAAQIDLVGRQVALFARLKLADSASLKGDPAAGD
ncbi:NADPH-dependent FMN reductase [Sphingomonas bacterium]|uniref:NADPH-dependent FMN reductase n=1 Tax=Sphingomonas bacterium TaxID=1895847 RepID=UPI0015770F43|nr:NAD(P)H-dependent oxidoreductase [Sphingomonas bacterium]